MKLETYGKIGISVGIALGIFVIVLLSITVVPDMINRQFNHHRDIQVQESEIKDNPDVSYVKSILNQTEAYIAFVERYPDHVSQFQMYDDGGRYHLFVTNTDTNNILEVYLEWNTHDASSIHMNANCRIGSSIDDSEIRVRDSAVINFIKNTDCI